MADVYDTYGRYLVPDFPFLYFHAKAYRKGNRRGCCERLIQTKQKRKQNLLTAQSLVTLEVEAVSVAVNGQSRDQLPIKT